jgi:hypothetical protein
VRVTSVPKRARGRSGHDEDSTLTLLSTTDKNPFDVCAALS